MCVRACVGGWAEAGALRAPAVASMHARVHAWAHPRPHVRTRSITLLHACTERAHNTRTCTLASIVPLALIPVHAGGRLGGGRAASHTR